jgi:hypothetical protein
VAPPPAGSVAAVARSPRPGLPEANRPRSSAWRRSPHLVDIRPAAEVVGLGGYELRRPPLDWDSRPARRGAIIGACLYEGGPTPAAEASHLRAIALSPATTASVGPMAGT